MNDLSSNALELTQLALLGEAAEHLDGAGIFVWDEERNYVAVNDAACELTGLSRDELLKLQVGDMTPDRAEPHFAEVQRRGIHVGQSHIDRRDGTRVDICWITTSTRIASLPYMVSVVWRRPE